MRVERSTAPHGNTPHGNTPHGASSPLTLALKGVRLLRSFIAARDGDNSLQPLDEAICAAVAGIRVRAAYDMATALKVQVVRRLAVCGWG